MFLRIMPNSERSPKELLLFEKDHFTLFPKRKICSHAGEYKHNLILPTLSHIPLLSPWSLHPNATNLLWALCYVMQMNLCTCCYLDAVFLSLLWRQTPLYLLRLGSYNVSFKLRQLRRKGELTQTEV